MVLVAPLGIGCSQTECEEGHTCPPATTVGTPPARCVPGESQAIVGDDCGVFVASDGDDEADGTKDAPMRTLSAAIARAAEGQRRVYACAEELVEAVKVPAGLAIFGGLDCADGWAWVGQTRKTTLTAEPDAIPLTLLGGEQDTLVHDALVRAADAQTPGGSSIAVLANQAKAVLRRCEIVAGSGSDGAQGPDGLMENPPAQPLSGDGGIAVAGSVLTAGGAPVVNRCQDDQTSVGGRGGDGYESYGAAGSDGLVDYNGQSGSEGLGGNGEPDGASLDTWSCDGASTDLQGNGRAGQNGENGSPGQGASGLGALTASGYTGEPGSAGTRGKPGQGGGGGGGARFHGSGSGSGASGGSGGAGGCGGQPGQGGGPGGASIALATFEAHVTLAECTLTAGPGGRGGAGGKGQAGSAGSQGGKGGDGGVGNAGNITGDACAGGPGGEGGSGGPGGGGRGGHSVAIAYKGQRAQQSGAVSLSGGTPGEGGPGGDSPVAGNAGSQGITTEELELP
ncbi:MAG: PGRS family protein [Polyangiaceae bacterium]|nr:PGRS family protein [Polyangiaceae bacterium]